MSWWDPSGISSFASQAIKNAQKKIDKVLDIQGEEKKSPDQEPQGATRKKTEKPTAGKDGDFWTTWLPQAGEESTEQAASPSSPTSGKEDSEQKPKKKSAWTFGWGDFSEEQETAEDESSLQPQPSSSAAAPESSVKTSSEASSARQAGAGEAESSSAKPGAERRPDSPPQEEGGKSGISPSDEGPSEDVPPKDILSASKSLSQIREGIVESVSEPALPAQESDSEQASAESPRADDKVDSEDTSTLGLNAATDVFEDLVPGPSSEVEDNADTPPEAAADISPVPQSSLSVKADDSDSEISSTPQTDTRAEPPDLPGLDTHSSPEESATSSEVCEDSAKTSKTEPSYSQTVTKEPEPTASLSDSTVTHPEDDDERHLPVSPDKAEQSLQPSLSEFDSSPFASLSEAEAAEAKWKEEGEEDSQNVLAGAMSMSASSSSIITISSPDQLDQGAWFSPTATHQDHSSSTEPSGSASENFLSPTVSETVCIKQEVREVHTNTSSDISPVSDTIDSADGVFEPVAKSSSISLVADSADTSQDSQRAPAAAPVSPDFSDSPVESASPEVGGRLREVGDLRDSTSSGNSSDTNRLDSSLDTCNSEDTVVDRGDLQAEEGQEQEDNDDAQSDTFSGASPYSSYVKCMIEEAMEDTTRVEDSGSDNHSSGGKSEIDKSVSGHDSSDDIETTTSSDIEIISTPTPNGDGKGGAELLFDLSPLRMAFRKSRRRGSSPPGHRRNDSQSSSSTYSKAGESDQLSPGRDSMERQDPESGDEHDHGLLAAHSQELSKQASSVPEMSEEDLDNPYHPRTLLKLNFQDNKEIIKKLAEMAEVLQARESKLVTLSRENNDLLETNAILRSQIQQLEGAREAEMTDLNALTAEFTRRIGEADRKLQAVIREKENMKIQLTTAQEELSKRAKDISHEKLLAEKDEQIAELLQEGEKLSKQQLQSNNIIKKLRAKEKENDALIASQKKKLEQQAVELEHLRKVCDAKDDLEKKQTEAIGQLNAAVQMQEKEIAKLKAEQGEHQEKVRSLQTALDNSYKELADLHKSNAAQDSKLQEAALSAQVQAREELRFSFEKEQQKAKAEREALIMQIEDLRLTMARMEKEHSRREDMLRQEISDLQQQIQEDEGRNQELTQSVTSATRPLLRQIENLQSTYAAQANSWEKVEKNLTERILELQTQLAVAVEKERTAGERVAELSSQVTSLETNNQRLRQERAQLLAQAQVERAKIEELEDAKSNEMAQVEAIKKQMSQEVSDLRKSKILLETQLDMERSKLESERRKLAHAEDQIKLLERERPQSRGTPSPVSVSRQESIASLTDSMTASMNASFHQLQEDGERGILWTGSPSGGRSSVYETLRHSGAAGLLEGLQSQLKQKEGEISQLQSEITGLERTRESMAKELVNLSNQNEELKEQADSVPVLQTKLSELESRYNALLQMYGEKVEEADELRLDLQDVKDMYKTQIDQLLAK